MLNTQSPNDLFAVYSLNQYMVLHGQKWLINCDIWAMPTLDYGITILQLLVI